MIVIGSVLAQRYRIDQQLASGQASHGVLLQGQLGEGLTCWRRMLRWPCASCRTLSPRPVSDNSGRRCRPFSILRFPALGACWRRTGLFGWCEWQQGTPFDQIQQQRVERQLVFGAGEVLLLLRQLLRLLPSCMPMAWCTVI